MTGTTKAKAGGLDRGRLLRTIRDLHGYLSAVAFIALILFSATGLLLNHPEWLDSGEPATEQRTYVIPAPVLARAKADPEPARAIAQHLDGAGLVVGAFISGEVIDQEAVIRFESPRGTSDVTVDLGAGVAEVSVARAGVIALINELHRGKNAGAAWKLVIDAVAWLTIAMSLFGYALFLMMRARVATALALTALGAAGLAGAAIFLVP